MAATKNTKAFYNTEIPGDWEIVKVLDFGKVYTGNTPSTSESENYDGTYLFVSPGDLSEVKYIDKTEKTLTEKGFATSRKFPRGSVLFTCIGSTIGKSGIATVDLTANQQINAIVVNNLNSNEYLYYQALALEKLGRTSEAQATVARLAASAEKKLRDGGETDFFSKFGETGNEKLMLANTHYQLGLARLAQKNAKEAKASFRTALEWRADHLWAQTMLKSMEQMK